MTDQEIRWMIEDFQVAGLDQEDHSLKGSLRAKQQLWYLEALTEALQLSPQQREQAKERMDALLAEDLAAFEMGIAGVGANAQMARVSDILPVAPMAGAEVWLMKDAYAPWNLCDLTKEQDQLTMHLWRDTERKSALKNESTDSDSAQVRPWVQSVATKLDPVSGNIIEFDQIQLEGDALYGRIIVVDAFPHTPNQKEPMSIKGVDQARSLQSPQLRMSMLLDQDTAAELLSQLDNPTTLQPYTQDPGIITEPPTELPPNTVEPETPVDPVPEPDSK